MITTKDLGALNELMTFENWMALKLWNYSKEIGEGQLKKSFEEMKQVHADQHQVLLNYLEAKSTKGGQK